MNNIQTSLLALLAVMILTLSMSLIADQTDVQRPNAVGPSADKAGGVVTTDPAEPLVPELITASSRKPMESPSSATSGLSAVGPQEDEARVEDKAISEEEAMSLAASADGNPNREKVWSDINEAITSLNDMVGDDMFRELTRKNATTMEVRVDLDYWQRVRYETRVDLKNDISNIWHLYVRQYNDDNDSAVFFIDDKSGKTIDIFTQRHRPEQ